MTALADLLRPTDRDRLAARLAELRDLASVMRQRAALAPAPVPPPLHRIAQRSKETTTS